MASRPAHQMTPKKPLHTTDGSEPDTGVITHPFHAHVSADHVARIVGRRRKKANRKTSS